jgi:hypothetical protein
MWTSIRRMLKNKNKQGDKDILQAADIVKFTKALQPRCSVMLKECKIMNAKIHGNSCNGKNKEKKNTT